jgi:protein-L-isoaspartate(D-aspartate) O-methyltransferase
MALVQSRWNGSSVPAPCFGERRGHDYFARWISAVAIFPCAGSRDEVSERALAKAFANGGWQKVTRLYRDREDERCLLRGPRWCLATI